MFNKLNYRTILIGGIVGALVTLINPANTNLPPIVIAFISGVGIAWVVDNIWKEKVHR